MPIHPRNLRRIAGAALIVAEVALLNTFSGRGIPEKRRLPSRRHEVDAEEEGSPVFQDALKELCGNMSIFSLFYNFLEEPRNIRHQAL